MIPSRPFSAQRESSCSASHATGLFFPAFTSNKHTHSLQPQCLFPRSADALSRSQFSFLTFQTYRGSPFPLLSQSTSIVPNCLWGFWVVTGPGPVCSSTRHLDDLASSGVRDVAFFLPGQSHGLRDPFLLSIGNPFFEGIRRDRCCANHDSSA